MGVILEFPYVKITLTEHKYYTELINLNTNVDSTNSIFVKGFIVNHFHIPNRIFLLYRNVNRTRYNLTLNCIYHFNYTCLNNHLYEYNFDNSNSPRTTLLITNCTYVALNFYGNIEWGISSYKCEINYSTRFFFAKRSLLRPPPNKRLVSNTKNKRANFK